MIQDHYPVAPIVIPTPFPVGPVNVYLLDGRSPALVDAGPDTVEAKEALIAGLAANGRQLSDIRQVVITHSHPDHYGLAAWVAAESGAQVVAHHFSVARISGERAPAASQYLALGGILLAAGVPMAELEAMQRDLYHASNYSRPVTVDRVVEDGDILELGEGSWEVLHTPGHARGHICLYHPLSGQLLSGDHLLREISSNPILEAPRPGERARPRSLVDYIGALQRVAALEVAVAWPGHGEPIEDLPGLVARRIAFHRRRADEIVDYLAAGPHSAYQISQALFPDLSGIQLFLGISEVVGHLDILEDENRIVVCRDEKPATYKVATDPQRRD
jgi:glyoxylase-like metal-dependent hydrolase (beta-lactamase superfamily II)